MLWYVIIICGIAKEVHVEHIAVPLTKVKTMWYVSLKLNLLVKGKIDVLNNPTSRPRPVPP
jgi:hypothetical protein